MMNRTTKNAPFGTDNTPLLQYKIIGGKRVEVLAKVEPSSIDKSDNWSDRKSSHRGPHGTPSMLTQPIFRDYEYADLQRGFNTAKQHKVAREVTSYTSPFGDRTQSFRHGIPDLNTHPILPPIGKSQPSGSNFVHESVNKEDLQDVYRRKDLSDNSLEATVGRSLHAYNNYKIKDMYVELSGFDRKLSGFVSEPQLSLICLRHDLPLKLSTMKLIFHKFSDPSDPSQINYEKFLQFISTCMSNPRLSNTSTGKSQDSKPSSSSARKNHSASSPATPQRKDGSNSYSVDEKLVVMLKEQLFDCEDFNVDKLRKALLAADRLGNGELKADAILQACVNERLPLTSSILTHLLQQAEIAHGIVNWYQFLAPLECAYKQLFPTNISTSQSSTLRHTSNPVSAANSWKPDHVNGSEKISPHGKANLFQTDNNDQNLPSSRKVSLRKHLSAGWDERQPIGTNDLLTSEDRGTPKEDSIKSPRRGELWMKNFTRLAHALRSYHPLKHDILPRSEVERMVKNYNLIYSLGFSTAGITNATNRAVSSHSTNGDQQSVSVDLVLKILAELPHEN